MNTINCTHCGTPLTGTLDTYGDVGDEQCFKCYFADVSEVDIRELELLDTIKYAEIEVDAAEDALWWHSKGDEETLEALTDHLWLVRGELNAALQDLELYRQRTHEPLERWRELVGAA